jgi:hypothetical protein
VAYRKRFGIYNVGWVSARRCDEGIAALNWWRERCIEWCHDFVDGDRFADQRYLDRLPGLFPNVHVIGHLGANLAPWNFADLRVEWRDDTVLVERRYQLLFFHFHGVRHVGRYYFNSHRVFHAPFPELMRRRIYQPYIAALAAAEFEAGPYLEDVPVKAIRKWAIGSPADHVFNLFRRTRALVFQGLDIVTRRAIVAPSSSAR